MSLIETLNKNLGKTPDQIIQALFTPWMVLRRHDESWYNANLDRLVFLFNASGFNAGYWTRDGGRPESFDQAEAMPVRHWPAGVFTFDRVDEWFFAYAENAVPFQIGVHDVQAVETFERERR